MDAIPNKANLFIGVFYDFICKESKI